MAALLYHFGRYLMIASSRPGTQATNLQGIWNHLLMPPWGSNYTTNINTEMNYWPAENTSLAECAEPLFRLIREYAEQGRSGGETLPLQRLVPASQCGHLAFRIARNRQGSVGILAGLRSMALPSYL